MRSVLLALALALASGRQVFRDRPAQLVQAREEVQSTPEPAQKRPRADVVFLDWAGAESGAPARSLDPVRGLGTGLQRSEVLGLAGVLLLLLLALSPMAVTQGLVPFLSVLLYIISICFVKVFAKQAFNHGFHFPYSLTALHMLATAVVASCIDRPLLGEAAATLRISVAKAASLGLNNCALGFGGAAFVSIVGALTPCTTFAVDAARTWQLSLFRLGAVLLACAGAAVSTQGGSQVQFSMLALLLGLAACLTRSLKVVWAHDLLEAEVSVYRLAAWSALWSLLIMLVLGLCIEGPAQPAAALRTLDGAGVMGVVVSCVAAAALNILQCAVLKHLGPVLQNLFGSLELLAVIMLAIVVLREEVSGMEWLGALLVCAGCAVVKAEGPLREGLALLLRRGEARKA